MKHTILDVKRIGCSGTSFSVINPSEIISIVSQQILQYGNIYNRNGCIYGIKCNDKKVRAMAQYVVNKYSSKKIEGWKSTCPEFTLPHYLVTREKSRYEKRYEHENRIKISVKELDDYYRYVLAKNS